MIGTLTGIIGAVLTLTFGLVALRSTNRGRLKTRVRFEKSECYQLFRNAVKRLNIEIQYENKPISEQLILLKARLINSGSRDIDSNQIYDPIKIITTEKYKWLEVNIVEEPDKIKSSSTLINSNKLEINWDLLKRDEFIEFEALIGYNDNEDDIPSTSDFFNSLSFNYRITDLEKIEKDKAISETEKRIKSKLRDLNIMIIIMFSLGYIFLINGNGIDRLIPKYPKSTNKPVYIILTPEKDTIYTQLKSIDNNQLLITNSNTNQKSIIDIKKFTACYSIIGVEKIESRKYLDLMAGISGIIWILFGTIILIVRYNYKKRLKTVANIAYKK